MVARNIHDTARDKDLIRLSAHQDGDGRKVIDYSDGTEVRTERTAPGANRPDGRPALREVRTITRVKTPGSHFVGGFGEVGYDRKLVARKEGE